MEIKRLLSLAIAIVLLITALTVTSSQKVEAIAGPGDDDAEEVNNVEDAISVLYSFMGSGSDEASSSRNQLLGYGTVENYLSLLSYDDFDFEEHESATINILTTMKQTASSNSENANYEYSVTRDLTIYINEDETCYDSRGEIFNSSSSNGERSSSYAKFDMLIYVDYGSAYVYFKEYLAVSDNATSQIKSEYLRKWIEIPEDAVEELIDLDQMNRDVFSSIATLLTVLVEVDEISLKDKSVSISPSDWEKIQEKYEDDMPSSLLSGYDVKFDVDLSKSTQPYFAIIATNDYNGSGYDSEVTEDMRVTMRDIDNTVISFDDDDVYEDFSDEDDFERIFNVEKVEKDED